MRSWPMSVRWSSESSRPTPSRSGTPWLLRRRIWARRSRSASSAATRAATTGCTSTPARSRGGRCMRRRGRRPRRRRPGVRVGCARLPRRLRDGRPGTGNASCSADSPRASIACPEAGERVRGRRAAQRQRGRQARRRHRALHGVRRTARPRARRLDRAARLTAPRRRRRARQPCRPRRARSARRGRSAAGTRASRGPAAESRRPAVFERHPVRGVVDVPEPVDVGRAKRPRRRRPRAPAHGSVKRVGARRPAADVP